MQDFENQYDITKEGKTLDADFTHWDKTPATIILDNTMTDPAGFKVKYTDNPTYTITVRPEGGTDTYATPPAGWTRSTNGDWKFSYTTGGDAVSYADALSALTSGVHWTIKEGTKSYNNDTYDKWSSSAIVSLDNEIGTDITF